MILTILKYLKIIFFIILRSSIEFKKPSPKKFLIFDKTNSEILQKYLKNKYCILHTRNEKINIFIVIKNIIKFKFSKIEYYNTYIEFVEPKIIITAIDNNPAFYLLNKKYNQKKILIQMGWKSPIYDKSIFTLKNGIPKVVKNKKYNVDYIFVYNSEIGKFFKNLNAKKIIKIGSIKSNFFKIKNKKKTIDLLYISSWTNIKPNTEITKSINGEQYISKHIKILEIIAQYAKNNGLKLSVLGKRSTDDLEYNFYKNILKDKINWVFLKSKHHNSYHVTDKSKIVINLHSTLGYESLSRGNKTIFLDPFSKHLKAVNFGWPDRNFRKNGPFWTIKISYFNIKNLIDNLKKMNQLRFNKIKNKYVKRLMHIDYNNNKLIKILNIH
jgi:surface carbohydrate biosynthesis protein